MFNGHWALHLDVQMLFPVRNLGIQDTQGPLEKRIAEEAKSNGEGTGFDNPVA